jgi:glutathione S-transferase
MSLTLYYHPLASYCHKVLIALYENGTDFEKRIIDLGNESQRAELGALWSLCKFPVIRDRVRGRDLPESSVIIEYLDRYFPGSRPLIPSEWNAALEVRLWDRLFDSYVHEPMSQIVFNRITGDRCDVSRQRATLGSAYDLINRRLSNKTWVCGENFSMADCAAAPALFYASTIEPFPGASKYLRDYFEKLMAQPSVQRVIDEAKPYFSLYPFADRIPKRFL